MTHLWVISKSWKSNETLSHITIISITIDTFIDPPIRSICISFFMRAIYQEFTTFDTPSFATAIVNTIEIVIWFGCRRSCKFGCCSIGWCRCLGRCIGTTKCCCFIIPFSCCGFIFVFLFAFDSPAPVRPIKLFSHAGVCVFVLCRSQDIMALIGV